MTEPFLCSGNFDHSFTSLKDYLFSCFYLCLKVLKPSYWWSIWSFHILGGNCCVLYCHWNGVSGLLQAWGVFPHSKVFLQQLNRQQVQKLSQLQKDIKTSFKKLIWASVSSLYNADSLCKAVEDDIWDIITDFSEIWPMISHNLWTLCKLDNITSVTWKWCTLNNSSAVFPIALVASNLAPLPFAVITSRWKVHLPLWIWNNIVCLA